MTALAWKEHTEVNWIIDAANIVGLYKAREYDRYPVDGCTSHTITTGLCLNAVLVRVPHRRSI